MNAADLPAEARRDLDGRVVVSVDDTIVASDEDWLQAWLEENDLQTGGSSPHRESTVSRSSFS